MDGILDRLNDPRAVRLYCVQLLLPSRSGRSISALTIEAGELTAFILGTNDAEILRAARDLAEKVQGDG